MAKTVILAMSEREYAGKLAQYLREEEPGWEISAFTHESALTRALQESWTVDLLIGQPAMLHNIAESCSAVGRIMALVEDKGTSGGQWPEIVQYQPLPGLLAGIRAGLASPASAAASGCQVLTVFSASGGTGKTTVALNLIRQAGERGCRTFYLNLETLNSTSLLFGKGEPDSLSRLLYGLQAHPDEWTEQFGKLCRHHHQLRTDFVDAPDHPAERLALTPALLESLLEGLRGTGRYDLIVVDPDSGAGAWHSRLLQLSDQVVWLTVDDLQALAKADKLFRYWQGQASVDPDKLIFVLNKGRREGMCGPWRLPRSSPATVLPYIPEWKAVDQLGRLLGSPAFCGALDQLLNQMNLAVLRQHSHEREERGNDGNNRARVRGAG